MSAAYPVEALTVLRAAWQDQDGVTDSPEGHVAAFAEALADAGLLRDEPCTCKPPPIGEGPEEDCPRHGRPYSYWVEAVSEFGARVDDLTRERDRWREKAQESGKAYADANTKHHQELDRADRLERLADTLAEKAVDLEDRARAAEGERDDLLAMKARVEARVDDPRNAMDLWWKVTGDDWPVPEALPAKFLRAAMRGES